MEVRETPACTFNTPGPSTPLQITCDGANDSVQVDDFGGTINVWHNSTYRGFPGGTGSAPSITILAGAGADSVLINRNARPISINGGGGLDIVTAGYGVVGTLQGITRDLTITNPPAGGYTELNLFDRESTTARSVTVYADRITGLAPAAIRYAASDLRALNVFAGSGGNSFTVEGTPSSSFAGGMVTRLNTGTGLDTVGVRSTAGRLEIHGQGSRDRVTFGRSFSMQTISGAVHVTNSGNYTDLRMEDFQNTAGRTVEVTDTRVRGLAPADITFAESNVLGLNIQAGFGNDTVTVVDTPSNAQFTSVSLSTGAGTDAVSVRGTSSPLFLTLGDGTDSVTVGSAANTLSPILGRVNVVGGNGTDALTVNDQGTTSGQTYTLTTFEVMRSGAATVTYDVESLSLNAGNSSDTFRIQGVDSALTGGMRVATGGGNDTITVGSTSNTLATFRQALNLLQEGGNDTVTINDSGTTTAQTFTVENFGFARAGAPYISTGLIPNRVFNAGSGGNTFNIVNTYAGITTTLNTGSGNDTARATYNTGSANELRGPVTVNGQGGTDALTLTDPGTATRTWTVSGSGVGRSDAATVNYATVESVTVNAGSGNDTINVQGTAAGVTTTFNGGSGNDIFNVHSGQRLNGLQGPVNIHGQAGADELVVDDGATTSNHNWLVTAAAVSRTGAAAVTHGTVETLHYYAGLGHDTLAIQGVAPGLAEATVYGGDGDDRITVGTAAGSLDTIQSYLQVAGGLGQDSLVVDDRGSGAAHTYNFVLGDLVRGGGVRIWLGTIETKTLNTGSLNDTILVPRTSDPTIINAGAGNDTFVLGNASNSLADLQRELTLNGEAGTDRLTVNDQGTATAQSYTLAAALTRTGIAAINYGTMENVTLNAGQGDDTIRVRGTSAVTEVNAGGGNDTITLTNGGDELIGIGRVTVNGQAGTNDQVSVSDAGSSASRTFTVTSSTVRTGTFDLEYVAVEALSVAGGHAPDSFQVQSTAAGTTTSLLGYASAGRDIVSVGNQCRMTDLQGLLVVDGLNSTNLSLCDDQNPGGETWTVSATQVQRSGLAAIRYSGLTSLGLSTGNGADTISVLSTAANTPVTVNAGPGDDTVNIGADSLDPILGNLTVNGQAGADSLNINDQGGPDSRTYTVTAVAVTRDGTAPVAYGTMESLTVQAATASGHGIVVESTAAETPVTVLGSGLDSLWRLTGATYWSITGTDSGSLSGDGLEAPVYFYGCVNLLGGDGDDMFAFADGQGITGYIDGGAGNNLLDYSAYTTGVFVELQNFAGQGTAGVVNIAYVHGGLGDDYLHGDGQGNWLVGNGGHDILVGDEGGDWLLGGDGADQLYGGNGFDQLDGGNGEDLLFGGPTAYDNDVAALGEIWAEWTRADLAYAERIAVLRTGTASGYLLDATTVFEDADADLLYGEGDLDWFWGTDGFDGMDRLDPDEVLN